MCVLSTLQNLSRITGTALLFAVSKRFAFVCVSIEMLAYFVFKKLRDDFVVWIPALEGKTQFVGSILCHLVEKVLVDFSGMIHLRSPKLVGGRTFSLLLLYNQAFPFICLFFYNNR